MRELEEYSPVGELFRNASWQQSDSVYCTTTLVAIPIPSGQTALIWNRLGNSPARMHAQERKCAENMESLKQMDINQVASAIESDAGHALPGLRES